MSAKHKVTNFIFKHFESKSNLIKCGILALVCCIIPFTFGWQLERIVLESSESVLWNTYRWNVFLLCLIELIIFFLTQSFRATLIIYSAFLTLVYYINYFVLMYRGKIFTFRDIYTAKAAARIFRNYVYKPTPQMILCAVIALAIILIAVFVRYRIKKKWWVRVISIVIGLTLAFAGFKTFYGTDFFYNEGFIDGSYLNSIFYDGYMVASCLSPSGNGLKNPPDGYSKDDCEAILAEAGKNAEIIDNSDYPNIIVILNESFSDLTYDGDLVLSKDVLENFYSYHDNSILGTVDVSVLGGGTCNTEFELLTGLSMAFLPDSCYPYVECFDNPVESMVSCAKENNYTTISIHPELSVNWNRNSVYNTLRFDKSYWMNDFPKDSEYIGNGYSDRATYHKIEELLETKATGERLFIFDITMQNHGGYTYLEGDSSIKAENINSHDVDAYLSLIDESTKALNELTDYLEQSGEKTVILFFGDHQPRFDDNQVYIPLAKQTTDMTAEEQYLALYKTPFLIWANYDIEEKRDVEMSMNYLGNYLFETIGLPKNNYFHWLDSEYKKYPVISINGFSKAGDSAMHPWSEENGEFKEYRMLQYHQLFGKY